MIELGITIAKVVVAPFHAVLDRAGSNSGEGKQNEEKDDAATDDARLAKTIFAALIDGPFDKENDAGDNEHCGPPATVPIERLSPGESADLSEQEDDAEREDDKRSNDGAATKAAALSSELMPHGALLGNLIFRLIAEETTLIAKGVAVVDGRILSGRRGRGIRAHFIAHPLPKEIQTQLHQV
jgi:hypothetical protein